MALQMEYTNEYGLTTQAYIKIDDLIWKKENTMLRIEVFANKQARNEDKRPLEMIVEHFQPDLNSLDNLVKQAYTYLKTLPEFENAEDC